MPGSLIKLYECRVQAVRTRDRVIDAKSVSGRKFKGLSYLLPYISATGCGFDCSPQVGDTCLVLAGGPGQLEVAIGFRVNAADGGAGLELARRLDPLPEGSQCMRVLSEDGSEARIVCYRGGTVVVGSGSLATSVYTPMGAIVHLFDNWELKGPGGFVKWTRESGKDAVTYSAEYRTRVNPTKDGLRVNVDITPKGDKPLRVAVTRKKDDAHPALEIVVAANGRVSLNGNVIDINAYAALNLNAPTVTINNRRVRPTRDVI